MPPAPRSIASAQAQIDLRAQMEACPPVFCKVLGAFNIKGWKNGKKQLSLLEIHAYSGVPVETLKDALVGMVERGWLLRARSRRGKPYVYEKTISEMTWDEAHELARLRLTGEAQQQTLFDKKGEARASVPRGTPALEPADVPRGTGQDEKPNPPDPRAKLAPEAGSKLEEKAAGDEPNWPQGGGDLALGSGQIGPSLTLLSSSLSSSLSSKDPGAPEGAAASARKQVRKRTEKAAEPFRAHDGTSWAVLVEDFGSAWKAARRQIGAAGEGSDQERADLALHLRKGCGALSRMAKATGFTRGAFKARLANMSKHNFHRQKDFSLSYFCSNYSEFDDGNPAITGQGKRPGAYHGARGDDDDREI